MKKVLITGISGFLGLHIAIELLEQGYHVTGSLRNLKRKSEIIGILGKHTDNIQNLIFVEGDITNPEPWQEITKGLDYIIHSASPLPEVMPKNDDELIIPAKNGTLNILNAALKNSVQKVVVTSSMAAIVYGKNSSTKKNLYSEEDWTDETNHKDTNAYYRSKTIAEKAVWDFYKLNKDKIQITTINPSAILGPILKKETSASVNIVKKVLDGSTPAIPKIGLEVVDVRDVAKLHILAMENNNANGERFLCAAGFLNFKQIADILREEYPNKKIPKKILPNFLTRFISNFEKALKPILIDLDIERKVDNSKAKSILGWSPRTPKEAVLACAESLYTNGILNN